MKKLLKEFKTFVSKGSVIDLAIGMIIGSAFTAIVNSLVNGILKPLINWIPLSPNGTGLQTILREPVLGADGTVISEALILDWGGVISAIITFLITAIVLFAIIKLINTVKEAGEQASSKIKELAEKKEAEKKEENGEAIAEEVVAEEVAKEENVAIVEEIVTEPVVEATPTTTEDLLKEIIELLKNK